MDERTKTLFYMDELSDYKVASDYSDVRGWEVVDANSRSIGKVDNLLVNKNAERVVYLDVELDDSIIEVGHDPYQTPVTEGIHEFINKEGDNHLIIPIGMASLDENNKRVVTDQIDHSTFAKTKRFTKGQPINFAYEVNVVRQFGGDQTLDESADSGDWFYNRKEFDISKRKNK